MDPCICVCLIKKHVFMRGMFLSAESSMKSIILFPSFPTFLCHDSAQRGGGPYTPPPRGCRTELLGSPLSPGICHKLFSQSLGVLVCHTRLPREKTRDLCCIFSALFSACPLLPPLLGEAEKNLSFPQNHSSVRSRGICCQKNMCKWSDGLFDVQLRSSAWACRGRGMP